VIASLAVDRRMFDSKPVNADRESIAMSGVPTFLMALLLENALRWSNDDDGSNVGMKAALRSDGSVATENGRHSTDGSINI